MPRRITGRNTDGTEQAQALAGDCSVRLGAGSHALGEIVSGPATSPLRERGSAGVAGVSLAGSATIWVEGLEPAVLERGATTTVTVSGWGLVAGMFWQYDLPQDLGGGAHPGITVDEATWISPTEYELEVTVEADAQLVGNEEDPVVGPISFQIGPPPPPPEPEEGGGGGGGGGGG